jgi:hypothetical protein
MAEFAQRFRLDLPDPLTRDAKLAADLFKCPESAILQAKAKDDDLPLTFCELRQGITDLRFQELL